MRSTCRPTSSIALRILHLDIPKTPVTVSDFALVRRQFHIFERALKRFKSDVGLWIEYIQVAKKEGARSLVGRITARLVLISFLIQFPIINALPELFSCTQMSLRSTFLLLHTSWTIFLRPLQGHFFSVGSDSIRTVLRCG